QVLMSVDSGLTYTLLPNKYAITLGAATIQPNLIPTNRKGRIIVRSLSGLVADTSDYFKILIPELSLIKPNATTNWKMGNNLEVSWTSMDIDSIELHMSVDSGISYTKVSSNYSALVSSINFIPNLDPKSFFGKVIIKSLSDMNVADTSEFFNLEIPIGLLDSKINELNLSLYPNPLGNDNLIIDGLSKESEVLILDLFGREVYKNTSIESNELPLQFLTKGLYIVEVKLKEKHSIFRLLKD
ncbi:MAG: T9SS type A sorting domain-containing protein, partial [Dolichospermum sp.]